jgi:hypothetical protein
MKGNRMKRILLVFLCLTTSISHAENWQKSYDNGEGIIEYVDTDSIVIEGSKATASLKREFGEGNNFKGQDANGEWFIYSEIRSVKTIDCKTSRLTVNSTVKHSPDGAQKTEVKSYSESRIRPDNEWDVGAKEILCANAKGPEPVKPSTLGIKNGTVMPQHYPMREVTPKKGDLNAWYDKFQPGWYRIHEYNLDIKSDQPLVDTIKTSEDCFTPAMIKLVASTPVLAFAFDFENKCKMIQGELEDSLFYSRGACINKAEEVILKMAVVHLLEDRSKVVSHGYVIKDSGEKNSSPRVESAVGSTMYRQGDCPQ